MKKHRAKFSSSATTKHTQDRAPTKIKCLGWDCANKTLAWAYFEINLEQFSRACSLYSELIQTISSGATTPAAAEKIKKISIDMAAATDRVITIFSFGVEDILEGRKVANVEGAERSIALKRFLENSPVAISKIDPDTKVFIERQPSKIGQFVNVRALAVSYQLAFYYSDFEPTFVDPKLKDNITLPGKNTHRGKARAGAAAEYRARKNHSKDVFMHMAKLFGWENHIAGIPQSIINNLADAFLQVLVMIGKTYISRN